MRRKFDSVASALLAAIILFPPVTGSSPFTLARASCKQVSSCEEAVALWCNGYRRADGDSDGIPCENVCHSVEQVEEIKSRQGC
jgi:hypothetical protein